MVGHHDMLHLLFYFPEYNARNDKDRKCCTNWCRKRGKLYKKILFSHYSQRLRRKRKNVRLYRDLLWRNHFSFVARSKGSAFLLYLHVGAAREKGEKVSSYQEVHSRNSTWLLLLSEKMLLVKQEILPLGGLSSVYWENQVSQISAIFLKQHYQFPLGLILLNFEQNLVIIRSWIPLFSK